MRVYENKEELKTEINKTFEKYIAEFNNIPESLKDKRIDEVDITPAENLAYQVWWTTLVLKWEDDERNGLQVKTPSDEFKWNQLGELYKWFTDTYAYLSLQELKSTLNENINSKLLELKRILPMNKLHLIYNCYVRLWKYYKTIDYQIIWRRNNLQRNQESLFLILRC